MSSELQPQEKYSSEEFDMQCVVFSNLVHQGNLVRNNTFDYEEIIDYMEEFSNALDEVVQAVPTSNNRQAH